MIQIYECDTVAIRYIDQNKFIKYEDVLRILQPVRQHVFTFQITSQNGAEVEFIDTNGEIEEYTIEKL